MGKLRTPSHLAPEFFDGLSYFGILRFSFQYSEIDFQGPLRISLPEVELGEGLG